ncbi:MAG: protein translocase subunit SecD [Acidimicrobiales bacterium]
MVLIAVLGVGATILTGRSPLLGLDLKGGVSVVEQPQGRVTPSILQEAVQVIDRRVDGIGVSNSNVTRQGNDIVIELPGAKNDTQVLKVVGQTAQLFFRPVECIISPYLAPTPSTTAKTPTATTTTTAPGKPKLQPKSPGTTAKASSSAKSAAGAGGVMTLSSADAHLASAEFPIAAGTSTTAKVTSTTAKVTSTTSPAKGKAATTTPTTAPTTTTTSLAQGICNLSSTQQELYLPPGGNSHGVTPASSDTAGATVVLPDYAGYAYGRYVLGPAEMSGSIIKTATANLNSQTDQWEVDISFTGKGSSLFNKYAASHYQCYVQDESNPPYCALQAIALEATVEAAPAIEAASFPGGATINGSTSDPFTATQASDLALALSYGSLPVRFVAQDISNVSPQIGTASLNAGAIAGAVAVLLVLIYLIIYYRALGLVVVIGICMSGAFIYAITTLLSATEGLALTLSGVIGLIVSVGVTADSCVVYFERLKEEIRIGRTVRTSVEKGFNRAFRTILAADFSSFIAALVLYTLTVGDVRGFAFFLGLATLLNVVTTYFFTRPLVIMMGRRAALGEGGVLGVSRGLGAGAMGA